MQVDSRRRMCQPCETRSSTMLEGENNRVGVQCRTSTVEHACKRPLADCLMKVTDYRGRGSVLMPDINCGGPTCGSRRVFCSIIDSGGPHYLLPGNRATLSYFRAAHISSSLADRPALPPCGRRVGKLAANAHSTRNPR